MQTFKTALVTTASFEDDWFGRVFLYDPSRRINSVDSLGLLARVVEFTAPALHSVFLIRRLRSRSEASERARLARELHDTSVQSLIGLEMEVTALSRRTTDSSLRGAIDSVHARLQQEIASLRTLMSHLNKGSHGSGSLTERLTEMLARFQVETNIRARLLSSAALSAPPRIGQEMVRLVEAALSNVRRHSGATTVDVIVERDGDGWLLVIEDNGMGRSAAASRWPLRGACETASPPWAGSSWSNPATRPASVWRSDCRRLSCRLEPQEHEELATKDTKITMKNP
jgi:signal transduction histidine kinase